MKPVDVLVLGSRPAGLATAIAASRKGLRAAVIIRCKLPIDAAARAQTTTFTFGPSATKIDFRLAATLHAVHGTMPLRRGEIQFDAATGNTSGEALCNEAGRVGGPQAEFATLYGQCGLKNPSTRFLCLSDRARTEMDAVKELNTVAR